MHCIAGRWRGNDVHLVDRDTTPRLRVTASVPGVAGVEQDFALEEFAEPVLIDRGVHFAFVRGIAPAVLAAVLGAIGVVLVPFLAPIVVLVPVCVLLQSSLRSRYVVELPLRDGRQGIVLEMGRSEWLQFHLLRLGYRA